MFSSTCTVAMVTCNAKKMCITFSPIIGWRSSSRLVSHEWLATLWEDNRTNNRNNASSPKTITAANNEENYKLTRAATLLINLHLIPVFQSVFFWAIIVKPVRCIFTANFFWTINSFISLWGNNSESMSKITTS